MRKRSDSNNKSGSSDGPPRKLCSARKRSDSNNKAPSRNGNQPHVLVTIQVSIRFRIVKQLRIISGSLTVFFFPKFSEESNHFIILKINILYFFAKS
ncbi:hypothetical protein [Lysinibacillus sp. NPDC056232]|uniref:hypothetical protein n=1 Tax=Lysinibacillus sp. NPDC056232 TaxID=3345756 RepID=UPI0035DDC334